jgi:hypothetical protein
MLKNHSQYGLSIWILSVFFTLSGSFASMALQEHVNALKGPLHDNEQARTLIIRGIYQAGKVLDKKHVNLRPSYLSPAAGIIISAISFSIQHLGVL